MSITTHPDDDLVIKDSLQEVMATYALRLDGGNYYVGKTINLTRRLSEHIKLGEMSSAQWVDKHGFVAVDYICIGQDIEKEATLLYMQKYGWEKVRGYNWSKVEMEHPPKDFEKVCASLPFTFETLPMKAAGPAD